MLVDRVFALIKNGAAIKVEETDNCQFGSVQAVGVAGGTGCTIWYGGNGSTAAYNNHVNYVSGEIRSEAGEVGTTFNHMTAEAVVKQSAARPAARRGGIGKKRRGELQSIPSHDLRCASIPLGPGELLDLGRALAGFHGLHMCAPLQDNVSSSSDEPTCRAGSSNRSPSVAH